MTSAGRFNIAARRLASPQSCYVCLQCRLRASTASRATNPSITLPFASRRHAGSVTDRLRKKIWGTETPPGQEDPYGKEGVFDRRRREKEQEREKDRELEQVPQKEVGKSEDETEYVKATTAEGLGRVGGPGWGMEKWEEEESNYFYGFGQVHCEYCDAH